MDETTSQRLERLETEVAALREDITALRQTLAPAPSVQAALLRAQPRTPIAARPPQPAPEVTRAPHPPVAALTPIPRKPALPPMTMFDGLSVEELIGRYGTLILGAVTSLVCVGTLLHWAIEHGYFGPVARVITGSIAALAVAYLGLRMRIRGSREFGNVLLALGLAIGHVVCWNAGPHLHVVPTIVALIAAAASSVVLVEFALRHDEETLCAVGFGGAAIAPFVTSDDTGNTIALAAYGAVAISLFTAALAGRPWKVSRTLSFAAFFVYLLAVQIAGGEAVWAPVAERLGVMFPLVMLAAAIPLAHPRYRRTTIHVLAIGAFVGGLARAGAHGPDSLSLLLHLASIGIVLATLHLTRPGVLEAEELARTNPGQTAEAMATLDVVVLPLAFLGSALAATPGFTSWQSVSLIAGCTALGIWGTRRLRGEAGSEPYAATAMVAAFILIPALLDVERMPRLVTGFIVLGVAAAALHQRLPRQAFAAGAVLCAVVGSTMVLDLLDSRRAFEYVPFLTVESAVALLAVAGWAAVDRLFRLVPAEHVSSLQQSLARVVRYGVVIAAFLFVRQELAEAWSRQASMALLTAYYAVTGFVAIGVGRQRGVQPVRYAGLGLSLIAAIKVLSEAAAVSNIVVRVGLLFLVAVFLIAVAYWYRRERPPTTEELPVLEPVG